MFYISDALCAVVRSGFRVLCSDDTDWDAIEGAARTVTSMSLPPPPERINADELLMRALSDERLAEPRNPMLNHIFH